jgi:chromosome segregation ATPase
MSDNGPQKETSQLDRIEGSLKHIGAQLGKVLERLARMEQRQDSQAAEIESHRTQLEGHDQRIRKLEVNHAVVETQAQHTNSRSDSRWSSVRSLGMVILGSVLSAIGYLVVNFFGG